GAVPIPIGVIGADFEGKRLQEEFRALGAPLAGLVADHGRATSVKTRIIAHHQQGCRTDREDRGPVSTAIQEKIVQRFKGSMDKADAIIVSDYAKGLISRPLLRKILPAARAAGKIVCIDPKLRELGAYQPATVITPNTLEAERASGITISNTRELMRAGKRIIKLTRVKHLLVTRGEKGMALFEGDSRVTHIPTVA